MSKFRSDLQRPREWRGQGYSRPYPDMDRVQVPVFHPYQDGVGVPGSERTAPRGRRRKRHKKRSVPDSMATPSLESQRQRNTAGPPPHALVMPEGHRELTHKGGTYEPSSSLYNFARERSPMRDPYHSQWSKGKRHHGNDDTRTDEVPRDELRSFIPMTAHEGRHMQRYPGPIGSDPGYSSRAEENPMYSEFQDSWDRGQWRNHVSSPAGTPRYDWKAEHLEAPSSSARVPRGNPASSYPQQSSDTNSTSSRGDGGHYRHDQKKPFTMSYREAGMDGQAHEGQDRHRIPSGSKSSVRVSPISEPSSSIHGRLSAERLSDLPRASTSSVISKPSKSQNPSVSSASCVNFNQPDLGLSQNERLLFNNLLTTDPDLGESKVNVVSALQLRLDQLKKQLNEQEGLESKTPAVRAKATEDQKSKLSDGQPMMNAQYPLVATCPPKIEKPFQNQQPLPSSAAATSGVHEPWSALPSAAGATASESFPQIYEYDHQRYGEAQEFDRQRYGEAQEFDHQRYGEAQEFDRQRYGEAQKFDHQRYGEAQEFDRQRYGEAQEFDHQRYGEAQEFDRQRYGEAQEFDRQRYEEAQGYHEGSFSHISISRKCTGEASQDEESSGALNSVTFPPPVLGNPLPTESRNKPPKAVKKKQHRLRVYQSNLEMFKRKTRTITMTKAIAAGAFINSVLILKYTIDLASPLHMQRRGLLYFEDVALAYAEGRGFLEMKKSLFATAYMTLKKEPWEIMQASQDCARLLWADPSHPAVSVLVKVLGMPAQGLTRENWQVMERLATETDPRIEEATMIRGKVALTGRAVRINIGQQATSSQLPQPVLA